jgi:hypothetical protein
MEDILNNKNLKNNPFKVPDGYFKDVEKKIMDSVSAQKETYTLGENSTKKNNIFSLLKPAISMAAMFAIVFGFGYGVMKLTNTDSSGKNLESIFAEQELTEDEFIGLMGNANYEEIVNITEDINTISTDIQTNEEDIENYLIDSRVSSFLTLASLE